MTTLDYTDFVPTPAPLAAAAPFQSFIDPTGDVWVAQGGVKNGSWNRARDVLHAKWSRAAAWTAATTETTLGFDTANVDVFGMYVQASGQITVPIGGWWQFRMSAAVTSTAAAQWFQAVIRDTTNNIVNVSQAQAGGSGTLSAQTTYQGLLQAGTAVVPRHICSAALAGVTSQFWNYMSFDYMGSG